MLYVDFDPSTKPNETPRCYHDPVLTEGWVDYLTGPFGIVFAFAAGVISFLSPCVLPLVPAYIAHLTGVSAAPPRRRPARRETMSHALAFVCGFGVVFTVIGASVGLVGGLIARPSCRRWRRSPASSSSSSAST